MRTRVLTRLVSLVNLSIGLYMATAAAVVVFDLTINPFSSKERILAGLYMLLGVTQIYCNLVIFRPGNKYRITILAILTLFLIPIHHETVLVLMNDSTPTWIEKNIIILFAYWCIFNALVLFKQNSSSKNKDNSMYNT